jgi:hypothetical protein
LPETRRLPWGCAPSSRCRWRPQRAGIPGPDPHPSTAFHTPTTSSTPPTPWVCFTPQPRTGFHLQGFVPPAKPGMPRRHPVPSRRWLRVAAVGFPSAPRRVAPPSGPCSSRESVASTTGVSRRRARAPPGLQPPPGSPSP